MDIGMPKIARTMTARQVDSLREPGLHSVGGVTGLALQITPEGSRSWVLRVTIQGRRRSLGLGPFRDLTLSQARETAQEMRTRIKRGENPYAEKSAQRAAQKARTTFDDLAAEYLEGKRSEFRNPKHAAQWTSTLQTYASPIIGGRPVDRITVEHILQILEPIWWSKTETAKRTQGRIEKVMDYAAARGLCSPENPARWRGRLDAILPSPSKVRKVEHHPAVSVADAPAIYQAIHQREGIAARALEVLILTALRSGAVRGMTWDEVEGDVWTVPGERMKAGRTHRAVLVPRAQEVIAAMPKRAETDLVFAAPRGGPLSDASMTAAMKRMGLREVPHGWRSTFRDWASELTDYPAEVARMAMAHTIGDKVEAAYRRGDLLEKRRAIMRDWARYLGAE